MAKMTKDYFTNNEVLFVGYSRKNLPFSKMIYQAFTDQGIKVYPLNNRADGNYDVKVYNQFSDLPKVPTCAYVLLKKENAQRILQELADHGVKRILFHNKKIGDAEILSECKKLGIETAIACPMMILGSGLHRIHAFFAGVR